MTLHKRKHYLVLDSWRGIAACLVALFHFRNNVFGHVGTIEFFARGFLFVDFFFVLSGFIIFANYSTRLGSGSDLSKFMILRVGRLYPLHISIFLIYIVLEIAQYIVPALQAFSSSPPFQGVDSQMGDILPNLFLMHSFGLTDSLSFNGPSWSISAELWAYALFGSALFFFRRRIIYFLVSACIASALFLIYQDAYLTTTFKFGLIRCFYGFSTGAILWFLYKNTVKNFEKSHNSFSFMRWSFAEGVVVFVTILWMLFLSNGIEAMPIVFLFSAVIYVFSFEKGALSKILKYPFFTSVGMISYSVYMVHLFISGKYKLFLTKINSYFSLNMVSELDGKTVLGTNIWQGDVFTIVYLLLVIFVSFITYHVIEDPARKLVRKYIDKKNQV